MTEERDLGTCPCPLCGAIGPVRKMKAGRRKGCLYLVCQKHKQFMNPGQDFQDWILEHVTMHGPDGEPPAPAPIQSAPHVAPAEAAHVTAENPPPPNPQVRERGSFFPLFGA